MEESLELLKEVNWKAFWEIIRDIILPHSGTLIFNSILFLGTGFILSIILIVFLYRKKIFKRKPTYYNWIVKLYIPLLFFGFLYVFGQWGLLRGIYKILDKERPMIVAEVYNASLEQFFDSEEEKDMYVVSLQELAAKTKSDSKEFINFLKDHYKRKESKDQGFVESVENKLANFLLDHYGEEIYTIAKHYTSQSGDEIDVEGLKTNTSKALKNCRNLTAKANKIKKVWDEKYPKPVNCGKTKIGKPGLHLIKRGETLTSIADKYQTTVPLLKQVNNLSSNKILAGNYLKVPKK